MKRLVRACFTGQGYRYADSAADIGATYGFERVARLASNENPFPPPPAAISAGIEALQEAHRYPDERSRRLTTALRDRFGEHHFVTGVGMDGVIETVIRTIVEPGETITISTPTFSFYRLAAVAHGADVALCRRKEDFTVDAGAFVEACEGARLAFLCTPNNPTGNATPVRVIERILDQTECVLFLDNAYVEFSDEDYLPLLASHDRLIVGRTMSKAYSLAGLRVGYAFVPPWLEAAYRQAETPFALNRVSEAAAAAALQNEAHVLRIVEHVRRWRKRYLEEVPLRAFPSDANFVMMDVAPLSVEETMQRLAARGVVVRSCSGFPDLGDHYIRVGIGDDWECERFLEAIRDL